MNTNLYPPTGVLIASLGLSPELAACSSSPNNSGGSNTQGSGSSNTAEQGFARAATSDDIQRKGMIDDR